MDLSAGEEWKKGKVQNKIKFLFFFKKRLDKLIFMLYNNKALAGVAESADAHV